MVAGRDSLSPVARRRPMNIGQPKVVKLPDFIEASEHATELKSQCSLRSMQGGDIPATWVEA